MSLRNLVYDRLKADPGLLPLGISEDTLFPNFSTVDPSATGDRWIILRWGVGGTPPGRETTARTILLGVWVYDRQRDFGAIDDILRRTRVIMSELEAVKFEGGAVIATSLDSTSEDFEDDTYGAVTRADTFTIVASGT